MGNKVNTDIKVASTQIARIQVEQQNSLISANMTFLDYLREVKKVIDENGVIDVKALAGQKFHRGNGTDGLTDVYKIEMDEENKEYTLKYYGEASTEAELLLEIEDENMPEKIEIVEPEKLEDWEYEIDGNEAILTKYKGGAKELVVPNTIKGIPVKQVGDGINPIWDENNTNCVAYIQVSTVAYATFQVRIERIIISEGIKTIASKAFKKIHNLEEVEIPPSIITIENEAFSIGLRSRGTLTLEIPSTVINLGAYIVGAEDKIEVEYTSLEEVPDTWNPNWLKAVNTIDMPEVIYGAEIVYDDTRIIGTYEDWEYVIQNGKAILTKYYGNEEELVIPSNVKGIPVKQVGDGTDFLWDSNNKECTSEIWINTVVTESYQTRIRKIVISEGIEIIDSRAFKNILNLEEVVIPSSVTTIGNMAFHGQRGYQMVEYRSFTLKIPSTVINLGAYIVGAEDKIEVEYTSLEEVPDTWNPNWLKDVNNIDMVEVIYGVDI